MKTIFELSKPRSELEGHILLTLLLWFETHISDLLPQLAAPELEKIRRKESSYLVSSERNLGQLLSNCSVM